MSNISYKPTKQDKKTCRQIVRDYKIWRASKIKYLKCTYKGYGRPRKDDYITLPLVLLEDYMCYERLMNGFIR